MEKAFKVTVTPQNEDHIAKHGKDTNTFEADVVILTTEDNAFTAAASGPIEIAEAIAAFDCLVKDIKEKYARIEKALSIIEVLKSLRGIAGSIDRDEA